MSSKILFILKLREDYSHAHYGNKNLSTGLFNSANFMNEMLNEQGIDSVLEVAIDNNCIDRLVNLHKPTHVIIEALWVVPSKFDILQKLHPNVTWIVRLHSEMPFMAGEGIAMNWVGEYSRFRNVVVAVNAPRMYRETGIYLQTLHQWADHELRQKLIYLPNFYPKGYKTKKIDYTKDVVDVGCFGAVRPLKNHLLQAIAAVDFANKIGKKLRFHINAGRIEMQGQPVLNNLVGLFGNLAEQGHHLVNHHWVPRIEFLDVCAEMDIGMQCNFSETFNIVGADLISQGVPLVGTSEIPWQALGRAECTSSKDITNKLLCAYKYPRLNTTVNQWFLNKYCNTTSRIWEDYFNGDY